MLKSEIEALIRKILAEPPVNKIAEIAGKNIQPAARQQLLEAAVEIVDISSRVPHYLIKGMAKVLGGGYFFFAEYGLFLAIWSYYEVVVELLIMRELKLRPQETSIICGGLGFAAKLNMLFSLLARSSKNAEGIKLLKLAKQSAERNSFAHGFLYFDESTKRGSLLIRNVKEEYFVDTKHLDVETFGKHITEFVAQVIAVIKHFKIESYDCLAYTRSIAIDAQAHAEMASSRRESRSNAKLAKRKSLAQTRQKSPG